LPFLRIDFLRGEDRFAFGEFRLRPGDFETFNDATDRRLGELYLDAEARLYADLLAGRQFPVFMDWLAPLRSRGGSADG
jgi:TupA-like ATPgrasp